MTQTIIAIAVVVVGAIAALGYGWMVADMIPRPPKIGEPEAWKVDRDGRVYKPERRVVLKAKSERKPE